MRIIIGADIVPTKNNNQFFILGNKEALVGEKLASILDSAEYRVCNLETPISKTFSPIDKQGPCFNTEPEAVRGLNCLGINVVSLANNHIMDQGKQGLFNTINILNSSQIQWFGAGENARKASEPFLISEGDLDIGFYSCVEHEFSIATEIEPGANPYDPLVTFDDIAALKNKCDYVIVLYHGGKEYYRYPTSSLQRTCRKMIDKGADLVVCQHSHCIGCHEDYHGKRIIYGQGNFIFRKKSNEFWDSGLLIEVNIKKNCNSRISYYPYLGNDLGIQLASKEAAERILLDFYARSQQILEPGFIESNEKEFARKLYESYCLSFLNKNSSLIRRIVDKITQGDFTRRWLKKQMTKKRICTWINYIECESQRDILLTAMKQELEQMTDG